jgi:hypothetical protein
VKQDHMSAGPCLTNHWLCLYFPIVSHVEHPFSLIQ